MSEWFKEQAWKVCVRATVPWVRIPLSPPPNSWFSGLKSLNFLSSRRDARVVEWDGLENRFTRKGNEGREAWLAMASKTSPFEF